MSTELPLSTKIPCTLLLGIIAVMTKASQWGWWTRCASLSLEMCITFPESDVIILPLELICRLFVHVVNIGEWHLLRLLDIVFLLPIRFSSKVRFAKDRLDFVWGFCFRPIILWPSPLVVDVILEVPMADKLLDLIFEGDVLLSRETEFFVVSAVFVLIPFGAVSMQWVRHLEYTSLLRGHKYVLP